MTRVGLRARPFQTTLVVIAAVGVALLATTIALGVHEDGSGRARGWWLVMAISVVALLTVLLVREVIERTLIDHALEDAASALEEMSELTTSLGDEGRSVSDLLDDFADRVRTVLDGAWVTVGVPDDKTGLVHATAVAGDAPRREGDAVPAPSNNTSADRLAAPLTLGDQTGVVEIGAGPGRTFRRSDHDILRLLADRASVLIDQARLEDSGRRSALGATQARAHLALIAEVSIVLARALHDIRPSLDAVCDILVGSFADACWIDLLLEDGSLEHAAGRGRSPRSDDLARGPGTNTEPSLRRVLATGRSELSYVKPDGTIFGVADHLAQHMQAAGMTSWVVAPIRLRGLQFGTMTVATGKYRRGYRPSDEAAVNEIAGRVAISVERAVLFRDAHVAGLAAERRAEQLSTLLGSVSALTRTLSPREVLDNLVGHATALLDAPHAHATFGDELEASAGEPPSSATSIVGPLTDHTGRRLGQVRVERGSDRPFEHDEQALVGLIARFASSALQNARLFEAVTVREQRLGALFEASPLAVLEFDRDGAITDANPAAHELFGEDDLELPEDLRDILGTLQARTNKGLVADAEVSLADGTELWASAAPLYRGVDAVPEMLVVLTDTTERKRLEEQLIDAHRYEAIAQLAGGIAHDFNNLLTVIIGYSDLLLQEQPGNEDLRAMHEAGRLAAVITNQLLTLSRRQLVQPVVVDVASACAALGPTLQALVGDSIEIHTHHNGEARIKIDPGQLEQVVLNLVLNSRDASPLGGTVTISTELVNHDTVMVTVSDEGEGMDEETLARCLEPFFTRKGRRGIGLGLATVESIVQRAKGRLEIDSRLGQGTTISAFFPAAVGPSAEPTLGARKEHATVLLVDDDELIRRYASTVLDNAGFTVTTAGDAEEAISIIAADGGFDLVISDIVMPGMNGFELMRRVHDQWPHAGRLLITGYAGTDTTGTDLEEIAVLPKPFAGNDLVRAANDTLAPLEGRHGSKR